MLTLNINGQDVRLDAPGEMPLLWAIRDLLGYTGTKFGCGQGLCGACTVHLDGEAVRSCQITLADIGDEQVVTIEGLNDEIAATVQSVWTELDVPQCGYCQSGQIMSAVALLRQNKTPDDAAISDALYGNICRCGTYARIRNAVHEAARRLGA